MSQVGSFGVNANKVWDGTSIPLPARLGAVGSTPEGDYMFVQADGAVAQYAFVKISDDGQADELTTTNGVADDASTTRIQNVVGLTTLTGAGTVELKSTGHLKVN